MFLLLGAAADPLLLAVQDLLSAAGRTAETVGNPFADPRRTSWRLDQVGGRTWRAVGIPIEGVLARDVAVADPEGWRSEDLAYNRAETQAAVLGWLWGLGCPVIDRLPPWAWHRGRPAVHAWAAELARCGLPPLDRAVTDDPAAIEAALQETGGAVLEPLLGGTPHLAPLTALDGLLRLARHAPLHLVAPHGGAWRACVVEGHVVWDDAADPGSRALDQQLAAFARAVDLACVELVVAPTAQGPRTIGVEPRVRFALFGPAARAEIAQRVAGALLARAVPLEVAP